MDFKNSSQIVLALITSAGFFGCLFWMLKFGFPVENKDALNSLLGVLTTIWTLQMNWFFGSSSSTKAKDDTISDIAKAVPVVSGTGGSSGAGINIPGAESVKVETKEGNINVTKGDQS